jgi:hypothetical protein
LNITIYGIFYEGAPGSGLTLFFDEPRGRYSMSVDGRDYPGRVCRWLLSVPDGARLEGEGTGPRQLVWQEDGRELHATPNEAEAFAHLGTHGFALVHGEAL